VKAWITHHVLDILSTTLKGVRLTLVVDADEEGLAADIAPIVLGVLGVGVLLWLGRLLPVLLLLILLWLVLLLLVVRHVEVLYGSW